jgi:hypothetical protein
VAANGHFQAWRGDGQTGGGRAGPAHFLFISIRILESPLLRRVLRAVRGFRQGLCRAIVADRVLLA